MTTDGDELRGLTAARREIDIASRGTRMIDVWDEFVMPECRKVAEAGRYSLMLSMSGQVDVPTSTLDQMGVFLEYPEATRAFVESKKMKLIYLDSEAMELSWGAVEVNRVSK